MKSILLIIIDLIIALGIIILVIWGEYRLLYPLIGNEYSEWLIIIMIGTFFGLILLNGEIISCLFPNIGKVKVANSTQNSKHASYSQNKGQIKKTNNPPFITSKPLGGFLREQMDGIYLIGILIHQLYFSNIGNNMSERQQKESLNIQMRFFITVFPQRQADEYFDFSENFINKNNSLSNLSISQCIDNSIQILSSCNDKQIGKLRNLFNTLVTCYSKIGGGNYMAMNTFVNILDAELSSLVVEDDWRSNYAQKKKH